MMEGYREYDGSTLTTQVDKEGDNTVALSFSKGGEVLVRIELNRPGAVALVQILLEKLR